MDSLSLRLDKDVTEELGIKALDFYKDAVGLSIVDAWEFDKENYKLQVALKLTKTPRDILLRMLEKDFQPVTEFRNGMFRLFDNKFLGEKILIANTDNYSCEPDEAA